MSRLLGLRWLCTPALRPTNATPPVVIADLLWADVHLAAFFLTGISLRSCFTLFREVMNGSFGSWPPPAPAVGCLEGTDEFSVSLSLERVDRVCRSGDDLVGEKASWPSSFPTRWDSRKALSVSVGCANHVQASASIILVVYQSRLMKRSMSKPDCRFGLTSAVGPVNNDWGARRCLRWLGTNLQHPDMPTSLGGVSVQTSIHIHSRHPGTQRHLWQSQQMSKRFHRRQDESRAWDGGESALLDSDVIEQDYAWIHALDIAQTPLTALVFE
ncbi:hypothetical protein KC325_g312 [Hortaea werneckii]|nr:hypothetical protein KC325_g312 [Hortaea werneckii]